MFFIPIFGNIALAQPNAEDYAPIYYFEGEESCYPLDATYHLTNSDLYCFVDSDATKIDGWTYSDLDSAIDTCFLDNNQGTIKDNGVINHYKSVKSSYGYTIYYRTYSSATTDVLQYWTFYAFNKGDLNQHEGDWEMVQIVFKNDKPSWVAYSQHHSGQKATWSQVEKDGNHIKVYVARGSHANYLRSFSGKLGIASDTVGDNGKVLNPGGYTLVNIEYQSWIDYKGRWGEVPDTESEAYEAEILGQAGPEGPKYREDGKMWDDPVSWGNSLLEANDSLFILEWIMYNFILIFVLISLAIIGILVFKIYRRHKKYGLGPRFFSILYINGFNLHSIGNILCIIGIIIALVGLFTPWYNVSYSATGTGISDTFQTEGSDILSLDGINGLQVVLPGTSGPIPMGSFVLPFSIFIAIGLIFMIIATIGIPLSRKLGGKYIWRGIRLLIPFILIVVLIMAMGAIVPNDTAGEGSGKYITDILNSITSSPFGGETSATVTESGVTANISVQWGLGLGIWLLLIASIIMIISGILEFMAKSQFFVTKTPLPGQVPPKMPHQPPVVQQAPPPPPPQKLQKAEEQKGKKGKSKGKFCTGCGKELNDDTTFCTNCGKKR